MHIKVEIESNFKSSKRQALLLYHFFPSKLKTQAVCGCGSGIQLPI